MKKSVFRYTGIYAVRLYRALVSPFLPNSCRFEPSCSSFAIMAMEKYGLYRGLSLAIRRIMFCHPWSQRSGYDPVP